MNLDKKLIQENNLESTHIVSKGEVQLCIEFTCPKYMYILVTSEYGKSWNQEQQLFFDLDKAIETANNEVEAGSYYEFIVKKYELNENHDYVESYYEFYKCNDY